MFSPMRRLIFILIACLICNCLCFNGAAANTIADSDSSSSNNKSDDSDNSNSNRSGGSSNDNDYSAATVGRRWRIDITRKHSVQLNGVEIDETALLDHLEDHERELLFGKATTRRPLKLVQWEQLNDATVDHNGEALTATPEVAAQPPASRRVKRADNDATSSATPATTATTTTATATPTRQPGAQLSQELVSVQIKDHLQSVNLQLRPTPQLIDDAFVFIRRYANSTQFIEDSHQLAARYGRCFYSNENSALDLCDDENVRGVFHHNSTYYVIHPLPARFGNSSHVILESSTAGLATAADIAGVPLAATEIDTNLQFEPAEEEEEEEKRILESSSDLNIMNSSNVDDLERTTRPIRNTEYSSIAQQQHNNYHHSGSSKTAKHQLHLNLRYKPRYHHNAHQHQETPSKRPHKHKSSKHKHHQDHHQQESPHHQHHQPRHRRQINSRGVRSAVPQVLHIETAIFVDRDLFKHMSKNFPYNTESQMIRFVLAMINAVQLLYHDPSLGHRINFVLKRLEILYKDPPNLVRSDDIDTYLSNFCMWQKAGNPTSDFDTMHYDHAVILTGLDLYVVDKSGKKINQVVGLAPVAGMCTLTSSCTINEGKHFESVFVVAHEIGHNLGMRHDTSERNCDPSRFIMSPTLGSGKTTWSECSRNYLGEFLSKPQANCLFDRGQFANNLDHAAEGILPGERFDADQQCMLKYGSTSQRARNQKSSEICTDLHCQRDRYTWTSHPALEGTECGVNMWCRSGTCVSRPLTIQPYHPPKQATSVGKIGYEKSNFVESTKMGQLLHGEYSKQPATWSDWSEASECASGCLFGPSKRLREGSTGLRSYMRRCIDPRRRCLGRDHKYESCIAKECYTVDIITIADFAIDKCSRAQKLDSELTGEGVQIIGDIEDSCKVFCRTRTNSTKTRRWTFPDGTTCRSKRYKPEDVTYCIGGRCEKFSCDNSTQNYYKIDAAFCQQRQPQPPSASASQSPMSSTQVNTIAAENRRVSSYNALPQQHHSEHANHNNNYNSNNVGYWPATTYRSKYENEVALRPFHGQERERDAPYKRKADTSYQPWHKYSYPPVQPLSHIPQQSAVVPPTPASHDSESEWVVKSGCHSSCMAKSKGIQVVMSRRTGANNIQLCTHTVKPCERLLTPTEHAEHTCARYKLKVRGLSGYGTQIAASVDEPDRSCRVGCQDEFIKYRFYLVNGRYGHFPLGTKCSHTEERYCVNGKCLEFGADNIPLQQSHISLALFRNRREAASLAETAEAHANSRQKRSYLYFEPVNITETITQDFINGIVKSIMEFEHRQVADELLTQDHIEFNNPIHLSTVDVGN